MVMVTLLSKNVSRCLNALGISEFEQPRRVKYVSWIDVVMIIPFRTHVSNAEGDRLKQANHLWSWEVHVRVVAPLHYFRKALPSHFIEFVSLFLAIRKGACWNAEDVFVLWEGLRNRIAGYNTPRKFRIPGSGFVWFDVWWQSRWLLRFQHLKSIGLSGFYFVLLLFVRGTAVERSFLTHSNWYYATPNF